LSFDNNGFVNLHSAISELGTALKSPKLKCLEWSRNAIVSVEDMALFTQVLSQSDAVDELKFTMSGDDMSGDKIAQALLSGVDFSTYKVLDFSGNCVAVHKPSDLSLRRLRSDSP
ncbi:hypothetical protein THAOC_21663, partial [Thalassiosira oceanica]